MQKKHKSKLHSPIKQLTLRGGEGVTNSYSYDALKRKISESRLEEGVNEGSVR